MDDREPSGPADRPKTTRRRSQDAAPDPLAGLRPKERAFVVAYCTTAHFNGTRAAKAAGYTGTENALAKRASTLLRKGNLREGVSAYLRSKMLGAEEVLGLLQRQASLDAGQLDECYDDVDGRRVLNWAKVRAAGLGPLIRRVTPTKHGDAVELVDPQRAAELLAKHLGLLADRLKLETSVDVSSLTEEQLRALAAGKPPTSV